MTANKTTPTDRSVEQFLEAVADEGRREDCQALLHLMQAATGEPPKMWGSSMVGFGSYRYRCESGREGNWFQTGFSPRKQDLTLYVTAGFERYDGLLKRLGPHNTGKSWLYIKRLSDVDEAVLRELVADSVKHMRAIHGAR